MNKLAKNGIIALSVVVVLSWFVSIANKFNESPEIKAANKLAKLWIINNYAINPILYELEKWITRQEMLKVMMNLSGIKVDEKCTWKFDDLKESDWWCKYAETALNNGFIASNKMFRPKANVSKIEALKMILQAKGFTNNNLTEDWREEYVKIAVSKDMLSTWFTDYDSTWIRGWIFLVSANAVDLKSNSKNTCIDEPEGTPVITSISTNTWTTWEKIEIRGCNFAWFEWDLNAWIENKEGIKWLIHWESWSTSKLINFTLKPEICQIDISYSGLECESWLNLAPWDYKIYVTPWWKQSNKIDFKIVSSNN